jgi:poly-gamma-glutamate synthesis protein (capsule biosynthesis protein)
MARLFLCGDVMTGRGIDQIMRHPVDSQLHEPAVQSALDYVALAERASGPIPRAVPPEYVWGEALDELALVRPDLRIVNLETSVTRSAQWLPKGINYRMSPGNASCLAAAGIDCCVLANNHVLDWGRAGLLETVETLQKLRIRTAGAGATGAEAAAPAILDLPQGGRVLVFGYATHSSGVPPDWAARPGRPGVNRLPDLSRASVAEVVRQVAAVCRPGDITAASIHWGGNWGYEVPEEHRSFAHAVIAEAGVDIVHGHSSHHPRPIEVHDGKLVLYGCGDFLNDYEGISGYESYRDDLVLMYFPELDASGRIVRLVLTPMQIHEFRLRRPSDADVAWLGDRLSQVSAPFGTRLVPSGDGRFTLAWR